MWGVSIRSSLGNRAMKLSMAIRLGFRFLGERNIILAEEHALRPCECRPENRCDTPGRTKTNNELARSIKRSEQNNGDLGEPVIKSLPILLRARAQHHGGVARGVHT
jgi:hypothetical protein